MRKFVILSIALLAFAASAAATSAAPAAANKAPLIVAMRDPGCHWFYVAGDRIIASTSSRSLEAGR